jgi:hypothetical protein
VPGCGRTGGKDARYRTLVLAGIDLGGDVEVEAGPRLLVRFQASDLITFYLERMVVIDGVPCRSLAYPRARACTCLLASAGTFTSRRHHRHFSVTLLWHGTFLST